MEWYNILTIVIGAFGGITGIISLYNAKPNRTKIEVDVLNKVIDRLDAELANKERHSRRTKRKSTQEWPKSRGRLLPTELRMPNSAWPSIRRTDASTLRTSMTVLL